MLHLILVIALLGFIVYCITRWIPMPEPFKTAIYVICAVVLIVYLMGVLGISDMPVPRLR